MLFNYPMDGLLVKISTFRQDIAHALGAKVLRARMMDADTFAKGNRYGTIFVCIQR
jgi:hypothetical protein